MLSGRRVIRGAIALLALSGVLASGCDSGQGLPAGSTIITLNEGRRDATVSMTGVLHVELKGNAGTGYDWRLSAQDTSLLELIGPPRVTSADPGVTGGRTVTEFEFRPLRPGSATLEFKYVRPWETEAVRKAQVEVTVK